MALNIWMLRPNGRTAMIRSVPLVAASSTRTRHPFQCVALSLVFAITCASTSNAQWTVTNLHPAGASQSQALAASGAQQAGIADFGGPTHALLWSGTASSWMDLNPVGSSQSFAWSISGGQQAGLADFAGEARASWWSGTASTWVDLHPLGAFSSVAYAISGTQQAGNTFIAGTYHASLWSGTAASWIDLHPTVAESSGVFAIGTGRQAGTVRVGGAAHASKWSGTAASWVDLHPPGATESIAFCASGEEQAGFAVIGGLHRASLWSSTGAWLNLNPAGASYSEVHAMSDGQQVGEVHVGNWGHASLWSGTANSWVDLHVFLPAEYRSSLARGISSDGANLYVAGSGHNTLTGREEALLWTRCLLPIFSNQLVSQVVCLSGATSFSVAIGPTSPTTYQWQWQLPGDSSWLPITNGMNSLASIPQFEALGSTTFRVTIRPPVAPGGTRIWPSPGYRFRAVVSNTCGSVTSDEATLTVCAADFDCDGDITFFDYLDFVDAFSFQATTSDFNHDGGIDFFDYLDFADAFSIGC